VRSTIKAKGVQRVKGAEAIPVKHIFPYDIHAMAVHGEHCSMSERRADDATREVHAWLKCEYLQEHVGDEFNGVVSAVTSFGLFVELQDLYIEGLVHITALPGDYYNFDASHQRLTGERSGRSFQLGGRVRVQVARVDLDDKKIDLELVDSQPPRKSKVKKPGANAGKKAQGGKGSGGKGSGGNSPPGKKPPGKKPAGKSPRRKRPAGKSSGGKSSGSKGPGGKGSATGKTGGKPKSKTGLRRHH
jgi:ribonuclease R